MHRVRIVLFLSLLVVLISLQHSSVHNVNAQEPAKRTPESLMDKMIGQWVMEGTIGNEAIIHDVTVDRVLKRQYIRIHEISRKTEADGEPEYEAWIHIVWDKANEEFAIMWLDNTGPTNFSADGVGHGKLDGERIPFVWKLADGSGIHNTFTYNQTDDTWTWNIDNVDKSEKTSPFARVSLKRK